MEDSERLKKIGLRVTELRLMKNLTKTDLGNLCDIERPSIARIESGKTNPTYLTLVKLAKALEVSVADIVTYKGCI